MQENAQRDNSKEKQTDCHNVNPTWNRALALDPVYDADDPCDKHEGVDDVPYYRHLSYLFTQNVLYNTRYNILITE